MFIIFGLKRKGGFVRGNMKIDRNFLDYLIANDFVFSIKEEYTKDTVAFEMELTERLMKKVKVEPEQCTSRKLGPGRDRKSKTLIK